MIDKRLVKLEKELYVSLIKIRTVWILISFGFLFFYSWLVQFFDFSSFILVFILIFSVLRIIHSILVTSYEIYRDVRKIKKLKHSKLKKPPFYRFNKILGFLFTKKFYERVISEVLADAEIEYFDALGAGHEWQALWYKVLGYCFLLIAIFREIFAAIKDVLFGISKITK